MKKLRLFVIAIISVSLGMVLLVEPELVGAAGLPFGLGQFQGYFTGQTDTTEGGDALYDTAYGASCVNVPASRPCSEESGFPAFNASDFEGILQHRLYETGPYGTSLQDQMGAAFTIDTFLDHPAFTGTGGYAAGLAFAQKPSTWTAFVDLITMYDQNPCTGSNTCVQWDYYASYPPDFTNSYYSPTINDDAFYTEAPSSCTGSGSTCLVNYSITFFQNGNPVYYIKKNCGNVAQISGYSAPVSPQGEVYYTTPAGSPVGIPDVAVGNCQPGAGFVTTASDGTFSISNLNPGASFCVKAGYDTSPPYVIQYQNITYENPIITPGSLGGEACSADPSAQTYTSQTAQAGNSSGTCAPPDNKGYDVEYFPTVSGTVYYHDAATDKNIGVPATGTSGLQIQTCTGNGDISVTNSGPLGAGGFRFPVTNGQTFCVRTGDTVAAAESFTYSVGGITYGDPQVTPGDVSVTSTLTACEGDSTYEGQIANVPSSTGTCAPTGSDGDDEYNILLSPVGGATIKGQKLPSTTGTNAAEVWVNTSSGQKQSTNTGSTYTIGGIPASSGNHVYIAGVSNMLVEGYNYCTTSGCNPGSGPGGTNWNVVDGAVGASAVTTQSFPLTDGEVITLNWLYEACSGAACSVSSSPNPCQSFAAAGYPDITHVPVTLPDPTSDLPTSTYPPAETGAPSSGVAMEYTYSSPPTTETSIVDSDPATDAQHVTASLTSSPNANPVDLSYLPYYDTYAYDPNTPIVKYNLNYTLMEVSWTADTPIYGTAPCLEYVPGTTTCSELGSPPITGYSVTVTGITTAPETKAESIAGPTMPECYDREYSITPDAGYATWQATDEDPSSAQYTNDGITTTFSETNVVDLPGITTGSGPVWYTFLRTVSQVITPPVTTTLKVGICHENSDGTYSSNINFATLPDPTVISSSCPSPSYNRNIVYPASSAGAACTTSLPGIYTANAVSPAVYVTPLSELSDPRGNWSGDFVATSSCPADIDGPTPPTQVYYGDRACFILNFSSEEGYIDSTGALLGTPLLGPGSAGSCTDIAKAKPYLKVFAGDVTAGIDTGQIDACYDGTPGAIEAYNQGVSPGYNGSGTTLAAIARTGITGFASAQKDPGGASPPIGLTFANNTGTEWGGDFATSAATCSAATDGYYEQLDSAGGPITPDATAGDPQTVLNDLATLPAKPEYYLSATGGGAISGLTIGAGTHVVLFINGDLQINGPIKLNMSAGDTNIADLPSFEVITSSGHTIGVASNVDEIDGTYIAEKGTINDCTIAGSSTPTEVPPDEWFYDTRPDVPNPYSPDQTCTNGLTIYGSLTADTIDFDRTNGTLHNAYYLEPNTTSTTAEKIEYSPLVWLQPNLNPTKEVPLIESISSVPPTL